MNSIIQVELSSGILSLAVEKTDFNLDDICGFASRQNPKRGFLFVSKVLGKHYPVKPSKMKVIYNSLANKVCEHISLNNCPLFLGFAETATGLSSGVYQSWKNISQQKSYFIHTTRYHFSERNVLFNFQEEHSHATGHIVYQPKDENFSLNNHDTLVLVDDEMTTGKTMTNFIEEFLKLKECKIKKIILVCIKNWMLEESINLIRNKFPNIKLELVHILKGVYKFEKNEKFICEQMPKVDGNNLPKNGLINSNYGRFGIENFPIYDFSDVIKDIDKNKKTLVVGTGEFSYYPFLLAEFLEGNNVDVVYQSTTRSPIMIGNDIEAKLVFKDNYEDDIVNYLYNVKLEQYEQVLICYETNQINRLSLDETLKAKNVFFEKLRIIK